MAEKKGPPNANKIAMSRALGAAFLNHQVEQLEKSVSNNASAGNWRDRRFTPTVSTPPLPAKRVPNNVSPGKPANNRKKGNETRPRNNDKISSVDTAKDADIVVVDASVLVHGLDRIKTWGKNGREEIVIVPLEALNTLDLLKKGSTPLAQRARAASRVLEAQVGTNPRIRVQSDDAFVLWDQISFKTAGTESEAKSSPEWVRRTICCARWELDNAKADAPKVVLAVCSAPPTLSPQSQSVKLSSDVDSPPPLTPVPLPAPSAVHANKHEPRSSGTLVAHWAARAGIQLLDVKPVPVNTPAGNRRSSSEEEHPKRPPKGRRAPTTAAAENRKSLVERSPAVLAMMEMVSQPSKVVRVLARGEKLDPDP